MRAPVPPRPNRACDVIRGCRMLFISPPPSPISSPILPAMAWAQIRSIRQASNESAFHRWRRPLTVSFVPSVLPPPAPLSPSSFSSAPPNTRDDDYQSQNSNRSRASGRWRILARPQRQWPTLRKGWERTTTQPVPGPGAESVSVAPPCQKVNSYPHAVEKMRYLAFWRRKRLGFASGQLRFPQ